MKFYIVDVFSEKKYKGNQLAVFISDHPLSSNEMQQIAKEINFSEAAFIVSDEKTDGSYDVRIFTPDVEIPFAGHPTLGTAFIINKFLKDDKAEEIFLNFNAGQIPVLFSENDKYELCMEIYDCRIIN